MELNIQTYHLAQINIARMLAPIDDPLMAEFVAQLVPINMLADTSPGFVWRLQTEEGNATSLQVYDNDKIVVNMSVWEDVESLREFAYKSSHAGVMRNRKQWFEKFDGPYMALWWVPIGHIPSPEDGRERLERLRKDGDSPHAFSFKNVFPALEE